MATKGPDFLRTDAGSLVPAAPLDIGTLGRNGSKHRVEFRVYASQGRRGNP